MYRHLNILHQRLITLNYVTIEFTLMHGFSVSEIFKHLHLGALSHDELCLHLKHVADL